MDHSTEKQTREILARFAPSGITASPKMARIARQRLGAIALTLAAITAVSFLLTVAFSQPRPELFFGDLNIYLAEVGVAVDLAVAYLAFRGARLSDEALLTLGRLYLIARAATLSLSPMPEAGAPTLTWVAVLIVLFPLLFPYKKTSGPLVILIAASMQPLGLLLLSLVKDVDSIELARSATTAAFAAALGLVASDLARRYQLDAPLELGSYSLVRRLGRGGMGEVWEAEHRFLARPAAIKIIPRGENDDSRSAENKLRRFRREAQVTANLTSPHTVLVYDYGTTETGVYYYVMEYLAGADLQQLVDRHGPLPAGRAIHLTSQVCSSLAEAHSAGLIHRDLKPSNLFLVRRGLEADYIKVLDFGLVGLSAPLKDQSVDVAITGTNMMTGTPAYMSPEMVKGAEIDGRADIYALGCILFYLVTGELVFPRLRGMPMALAHAHEAPRSPADVKPELPEDLTRLIVSCLDKDPAKRPEDAQTLQGLLSGLSSAADWTSDDAAAWWDAHHPDSRTNEMKRAVRLGEESLSTPSHHHGSSQASSSKSS